LTADSDIYKYGVSGSELHISGRLHIVADWVRSTQHTHVALCLIVIDVICH